MNHKFSEYGSTPFQDKIKEGNIEEAIEMLGYGFDIGDEYIHSILSSAYKQYRNAPDVVAKRNVVNFHNSLLCGKVVQQKDAFEEDVLKYHAHIKGLGGALINAKLLEQEGGEFITKLPYKFCLANEKNGIAENNSRTIFLRYSDKRQCIKFKMEHESSFRKIDEDEDEQGMFEDLKKCLERKSLDKFQYNSELSTYFVKKGYYPLPYLLFVKPAPIQEPTVIKLTGFQTSSFLVYRMFHLLELFLKLRLNEVILSEIPGNQHQIKVELIAAIVEEIKREAQTLLISTYLEDIQNYMFDTLKKVHTLCCSLETAFFKNIIRTIIQMGRCDSLVLQMSSGGHCTYLQIKRDGAKYCFHVHNLGKGVRRNHPSLDNETRFASKCLGSLSKESFDKGNEGYQYIRSLYEYLFKSTQSWDEFSGLLYNEKAFDRVHFEPVNDDYFPKQSVGNCVAEGHNSVLHATLGHSFAKWFRRQEQALSNLAYPDSDPELHLDESAPSLFDIEMESDLFGLQNILDAHIDYLIVHCREGVIFFVRELEILVTSLRYGDRETLITLLDDNLSLNNFLRDKLCRDGVVPVSNGIALMLWALNENADDEAINIIYGLQVSITDLTTFLMSHRLKDLQKKISLHASQWCSGIRTHFGIWYSWAQPELESFKAQFGASPSISLLYTLNVLFLTSWFLFGRKISKEAIELSFNHIRDTIQQNEEDAFPFLFVLYRAIDWIREGGNNNRLLENILCVIIHATTSSDYHIRILSKAILDDIYSEKHDKHIQEMIGKIRTSSFEEALRHEEARSDVFENAEMTNNYSISPVRLTRTKRFAVWDFFKPCDALIFQKPLISEYITGDHEQRKQKVL